MMRYYDRENANRLKTLKNSLDDADRAMKAALINNVVDSTKALVGANAGLPFLVHRCDDAAAQNKIVDAALKQVGEIMILIKSRQKTLIVASVHPMSSR